MLKLLLAWIRYAFDNCLVNLADSAVTKLLAHPRRRESARLDARTDLWRPAGDGAHCAVLLLHNGDAEAEGRIRPPAGRIQAAARRPRRHGPGRESAPLPAPAHAARRAAAPRLGPG